MEMEHKSVLNDMEEKGFLHSVILKLVNLSRNSRKRPSRQLKALLGNQGISLSIRTIHRRLLGLVIRSIV